MFNINESQTRNAPHKIASERQINLDLVWIELTNACNLECVHCYCDSGPGVKIKNALKFEEYVSLIDSIAQSGCKNIQFIGGEPTLHKQIVPLLRYASTMGLGVEVFTNATFVSKPFLDACDLYNVRIATSFYSDKERVHDTITAKVGSFRETISGLKKFVQRGIPVRAEIIMMDHNRGDLPGARNLLNSLGITSVKATGLISAGRASDEAAASGLCGHCGDGRVAVAPDGSIYPCIMSRASPLGSIREANLLDVIGGAKLRSFRAELLQARRARSLTNQKAAFVTRSPYSPEVWMDCSPNQACGPNFIAPDDPEIQKDCSPNQACGPNFIAPDDPEIQKDCSPNQACSPN